MRAFWEAGKAWVLPVSGVCLVLGGLLGVQVHTQQSRGDMEAGRRSTALISMFSSSRAQLDLQTKEIERLRSQLAKYEKEAVSEKGAGALVTKELENSRIALGLVPVKGPGIELELGDSTIRKEAEVGGQDIYMIHDFDLLQVANELWAAGAEAVALNGQRLVSGSAIRCSGPLIQVNNTPIASPFRFLAIGNKENLMSALNMRGGVLDPLRWGKFQVKLTPRDEVIIPAVAIAPKHEYAKPVTEGRQ
jgi:uncharacterized protein YlxW (UPF0749 family)